MEEEFGVNVFEGLQKALRTQCPECGESNDGDALVCVNCGASLKESEESSGLDFVHLEGMPSSSSYEEDIRLGKKKIPLEESKNLLLLIESVEKLESGEIDLVQYRENVSVVNKVAWAGMELFKTDLFKKKIEELPEEQKQIALATGKLFEKYFQGCQLMLSYEGGEDGSMVLKGFRMAEEALTEMDKIQDKAMAISSEIQRERENS